MDQALLQFAARQRGLVTRTQAFSTGLSVRGIDWLLATKQLIREQRGVYRLPSHAKSWELSALAACLVHDGRLALSHLSAGFLYGLDGLKRPATIEVLSPEGLRVRLPGVIAHETRTHFDIVRHRGIPVTNLARTVLDLASVLTPEAFERALDSAQRQQSNLGSWLGYVMKQLGMRGPPGVALVKELLEQRLGITDSSLETDVTRALRKAHVVAWKHQFHVCDANGNRIIRADFAWPRHRVVLHADSFNWHRHREQFDLDREQRNALRDGGWEEFVVTSTSLKTNLWLEQLQRLLARRAPQGSLLLSAK
ncbi:MAG: type IV toxin-antitoxin system AbiEi family antitoxin domain-containing protein [Archangium sp.]